MTDPVDYLTVDVVNLGNPQECSITLKDGCANSRNDIRNINSRIDDNGDSMEVLSGNRMDRRTRTHSPFGSVAATMKKFSTKALIGSDEYFVSVFLDAIKLKKRVLIDILS